MIVNNGILLDLLWIRNDELLRLEREASEARTGLLLVTGDVTLIAEVETEEMERGERRIERLRDSFVSSAEIYAEKLSRLALLEDMICEVIAEAEDADTVVYSHTKRAFECNGGSGTDGNDS